MHHPWITSASPMHHPCNTRTITRASPVHHSCIRMGNNKSGYGSIRIIFMKYFHVIYLINVKPTEIVAGGNIVNLQLEWIVRMKIEHAGVKLWRSLCQTIPFLGYDLVLWNLHNALRNLHQWNLDWATIKLEKKISNFDWLRSSGASAANTSFFIPKVYGTIMCSDLREVMIKMKFCTEEVSHNYYLLNDDSKGDAHV